MKILFLEDDENRIAKARQGFVGHELHVVWTALGAITMLQTVPAGMAYDLVSLDHDLGGTQMGPSDEKSGYEVAKFIAQMETRPPVIVHSFNPVGAEKMMECLGKGHCWRALFNTAQYWKIVEAAAAACAPENPPAGFDDVELLGKRSSA